MKLTDVLKMLFYTLVSIVSQRLICLATGLTIGDELITANALVWAALLVLLDAIREAKS